MTDKVLTQGRFVWHDLMTRDIDKARAFYPELLGWSVTDMDMGPMGKYPLFKNGETGMGGAVSLADAPEAIPSHWINYISVHDVDATCIKATEIGGKVCHPAFDIPEVGRTAIIEDPNGAVFHIYKAAETEGPEVEPAPGAFCWYDCLCTDIEKAKAFYAEIFGWTFAKSEIKIPMEMWVASRDGKPCASIMGKPPSVPRSSWMNYIRVEDIKVSTARAEELGAKNLMGPVPMPTGGTFSVIMDPTGAHVLLLEKD